MTLKQQKSKFIKSMNTEFGLSYMLFMIGSILYIRNFIGRKGINIFVDDSSVNIQYHSLYLLMNVHVLG